MTTVLAIDQGTSGTKAIIFDDHDGVLATAEVELRPRYLPDGGVEIDPDLLADSVITAGRRTIAEANRPVAAICLANQGETVLAWDPDTGRPLSPAIGWQDRRSEPLVAELTDSADWVAERTGLTLDPYFSAPKLTWLRRQVTDAGVVSTSDSWLIHQLCGGFVTDASTASRSLLTRLDGGWDAELLELFQLQDERLPEIVGCDATVGRTEAFGGSIPVAGLIVDQQAALLGERCWQAGEAKCTFGTGAFLLAQCGESAIRSSTGLTASVAWRLHGRTSYCLDGQVYAAGSAVRWLQQLGVIADADQLDAVAANSAGSVLSVPALAGLAAPWWRSDATASITGLTLATGPGELVRATLEGIAAQIAELTDAMSTDLGRPLTTLRVDGGLTRCRTLMQAVADITQLPVEVYPLAHATAIGAAATGLLALDPSRSLTDVVPPFTAEENYDPIWSDDQAADFRERWRQVVAP